MILALLPYIVSVFITAFAGLLAMFLPQLINFLLSQIPSLIGNESAQVLNYLGFAGWIITKLQIPACLTVVITWMNIRLIIASIPFISRFV